MAMNLWSKNTKSSSGTSDLIGGESNVRNATPNHATVAVDSPPQDNQAEVTQNWLAQMAEVQEGWKKWCMWSFVWGHALHGTLSGKTSKRSNGRESTYMKAAEHR